MAKRLTKVQRAKYGLPVRKGAARKHSSTVWDSTVNLLLPEDFDESVRSKMFANFARAELAEAEAKNASVLGRVPPHKTFVDRVPSEDLDRAKKEIVFEFELLNDILGWIGAELVRHSPVGRDTDKRPGHPGLYRNSHLFYADRKLVPAGDPLPPADEYTFISPLPYARKIERGLSREQAPTGVYRIVADEADRKWGKLMSIKFTYIGLYADGVSLMHYVGKRELVGKIMAKGRSRKRALDIASGIIKRQKQTRQPAIVIRPKEL